jgi:cytochrome c oxidase subunit II
MAGDWLPFWPRNGATSASIVDTITIAEFALMALILALVFGMMISFCVRFRRGSPRQRHVVTKKSWHFEIAWTTATLIGFLILFVFGANAYVTMLNAPPHADLELYVVGKQWMWKIQHPGGQREIDAMHVPVGRTVKLLIASEDVIHDFYIPAFRIKRDAVPGQLETLWFKSTHPGEYRVECGEYCGTQHAHMIGTVTVMSAGEYARWLTDQGVADSMAQAGEKSFRRFGCSGCHGANSTVHAPPLAGLYGAIVHLDGGRAVRADDRYIRDCILLPAHERVAGYPPVMPSFAGQISEEELMRILAYIKSLTPDAPS